MDNQKEKTTVSYEAQKQSEISEKEKEVLQFWKDNNIFEKSVNNPGGVLLPKDYFSFYDGPPFATGLPHYGHILAGTIKDAIPRYQTMKGKSVRRVWGWDCHGLPVENLIEKKLGLNSKKEIEEYGIDKFNKEAYNSVLQYEKEWKEIVPRLGRFVDMEHSYKTMDPTYTESIWWAWKTLHDKGLAYEGNKMMHICPRCETTLAQSEVGMEYHDVTDISVTAKFELEDEKGTFVLAWTTTPWTLPGNTALAIKGNAMYEKISIQDLEGLYIVAKSRAKEIFGEEGEGTQWKVVEKIQGTQLVGKKYIPPFNYFLDKELKDPQGNIVSDDKKWRIWHADFITDTEGTGVAHEAPAFGSDDMDLAKANGIPVIKHVKMDGTFIDDVVDFKGIKVKQKDDTQSADIEIIKWLAHNGLLFEKHKIIHSYPLCWRCKTPLLNYATSSWFVDVPKMKDRLLTENKSISWTPEHIRDGRFGRWLEGAREWAVSRQRYWGAPIPVWKCSKCESVKVVSSINELAQDYVVKNKYFVMRHGETTTNKLNILDSKGNKENHLTDKGKEQVKTASAFLKEEKIDLIFASPFIRTQETAKIVMEETGCNDLITDERLREFDVGVYDGQDIHKYHNESYKIFSDLDLKVEGGESHRETINRLMSLLYETEKKYEGKKILFVTHGTPAWLFTVASQNYTDSQIVNGIKEINSVHFFHNAEVEMLKPKFVPRDETGNINLHRPFIDEVKFRCECGGEKERIKDVFDCWFESGAMPFASIHYPFENEYLFERDFPADFIAEGLDQTRGWFYSLINLGVGLFDKTPYNHVIVNGLVMASSGVKLSKSEGNYTDPMILVDKYGADAIRYALLSSPVVKGESVAFDDDYVSDIYKKNLLRLENVLAFYLMNKQDDIKASSSSKNILDVWIISRINELIKSSDEGYSKFLLDDAVRGVSLFIDDLSVWYTRRSRDRIKGERGDAEKRDSLETLAYILNTLSKVIAPAMPFISERIYKESGGERESVHLESFPDVGSINEEVISRMKETREIVSGALMIRTKNKIPVRQPLATIVVNKDDTLGSEYKEIIKDELNVKNVIFDNIAKEITLDLNITDELKKEGDLRNIIRAIQDKRKENKLSQSDIVSILISDINKISDLDMVKNLCKISNVEEDSSLVENEIKLSEGSIYFRII